MKTYRCGASLIPMVFWGGIALCLAIIVWRRAFPHIAVEDSRYLWQGVVALCLVLGPFATLAHGVRCLALTARIHPDEGINIRGREVIPWKEIRSIELRRSWLRPKGPSDDAATSISPHFGSASITAALLLGIYLLVLFVLLPVVVLLSPYPAGVTINLKNGKKIRLIDLVDSEQFARDARRGMSGTP